MNRVKIQGGLGNQLFQYAFARSLEEKYKEKIELVTSFYEGEYNQFSKVTPKREFELDKLNCKFRIIDSADKSRCERIVLEEEFEPNFRYSNTYFSGYWQGEKYFQNIKEEIIDEITLRDEYIDEDMMSLSLEMKACNSVALHVRRTDYLNISLYPVCDETYYKKSVENIINNTGKSVLYIFSDDMTWCKENLEDFCGCETHFVDTGIDYKDWYLMQQTRHNVIANSSFSWWAAYLNRSHDKIVCAPKKWTNLESVTVDLPESWLMF